MNSSSKTTAGQDVLTVTPEFKKEAAKSIIAIVGFILVYLLLFALSIGIVLLSVYGGIAIIALRPSFYTILIGLGLVGFGIMVFVFLIKFLFATSDTDNNDNIEVTAEDEPLLFQMINNLANEVGTSKPKKIYFTPDVNAAVFYNSSFWSMFLPIRKNLKIGLGLVNSVNTSELKAVIAHEFGHFSQRSMKVGSWVYQVNKIIYDMLYNNRGYANSLDSMSGVHAIFSLFASLTIKVVQGIQWVLRQMFTVVNKCYMGLSRQMEFHADLVAASVCGSNNIINALKRAEFAEICYSATLDLCNEAWKEKKVVTDFYSDHRTMVKHIAHRNQLSLIDGLPSMEENRSNGISNRVNYKNQWASHPSLEERSEYLQPFGLDAGVDNATAWTLFSDPENWKKLLTKQLYTAIPQDEVKGTLEHNEFEQLIAEQDKRFSFPPVFKEYYNSRQVANFDTEAIVHEPFVITSFEHIFVEKEILLPKKINSLSQDIAVLNAIIKKEITTHSFDFDGQKYKSKDAAQVLAELEAELEQKEKELASLDQRIFRFFYAIAPLAEAEKLKHDYQEYFSQRKKSEEFLDKVNRFMNVLAPIYRGETIPVETIQRVITNFKNDNEPDLKEEWRYWISAGGFENDAELREGIKKFLSADYQYFDFASNSFFEEELKDLNHLVQESWNSIYSFIFSSFKSITETQAIILEKKEHKELVQG